MEHIVEITRATHFAVQLVTVALLNLHAKLLFQGSLPSPPRGRFGEAEAAVRDVAIPTGWLRSGPIVPREELAVCVGDLAPQRAIGVVDDDDARRRLGRARHPRIHALHLEAARLVSLLVNESQGRWQRERRGPTMA